MLGAVLVHKGPTEHGFLFRPQVWVGVGLSSGLGCDWGGLSIIEGSRIISALVAVVGGWVEFLSMLCERGSVMVGS